MIFTRIPDSWTGICWDCKERCWPSATRCLPCFMRWSGSASIFNDWDIACQREASSAADRSWIAGYLVGIACGAAVMLINWLSKR